MAAAKKKASAADAEPVRFVRLLGIGAHAGGKALPIGKSLEIGVDIPEALAMARLEAETAEAVRGSAVTAQLLREAVAEMAARGRKALDLLLAQVEAAADADLADLVEHPELEPNEDDVAAAEAVKHLIGEHRAALEIEAAARPAEDAQKAE